MASRFQDQPEAVKEEEEQRKLGGLKITKIVDKPPVAAKEVKPEIEQSIKNAAKVMGSVNSMLRGYLEPSCELAIALKNASDVSKIKDAKYTEGKETYSVEVALSGRPLIVTVEIKGESVYAAVSNKQGEILGYFQQDGRTITVDGTGAKLNQKLIQK